MKGLAIVEFLLTKFNLLKIFWHHQTVNSTVNPFSFKRFLSLTRTIPVAKPTTVWKFDKRSRVTDVANHFQYFFIYLSWQHCPLSSLPLLKSFCLYRKTLLGTVRFQKAPKCRFWYSIFLSCLPLAMFFNPYRNFVTKMIIVFGIIFPIEYKLFELS